METGKPGLASAPVHISSVAAQAEKRMDIQAPLTAVYIHTVPALPAAAPEPATLHLAMPSLYSKETLSFLTLHIAGGLQSQPGSSLAAAPPAARPKSAGKHVCPHCGRDCMKPSVLEKHLRCHTGERPYPCITCGVSFKTQSNLYKHRRTQAHARLSSESEQSSVDSMSGSRETCTSSLSLEECSEESGIMEKDSSLAAAENTSPARTSKVCSVKTQSSVNEECEPTLANQNSEPNKSETVIKESEKLPLSVSRHLPLQRQEATLFSKQWESSVSRGKSQNHESTDSGFSETSDHYPSPGSVLLDHSMDSLTESTKEHLEEPTSRRTPIESDHGRLEPGVSAREQEQKTLEERISKLISDNTAVVEDKQLENVRPRKTVLSKQGSIDLPMPYTYKDSFHFDMRIGQNQNVFSQRNKKPGLYSSVPTQCSSTMEHAPLTRSNSLPFSVTLLQPERSSPTSSNQRDYVTLVRRGSSGQINPTGFTIKPVNQQSSTHRPLVRQTAVDCNHATDGLTRNSSVEEACTGSLSCDGDGGDICGEPSNRKFRRKKAQKFAYNKWYMYGGGTFKKLYNAEKSSDNSVIKGRKCSANSEHEVVQGLQKRAPVTTTGSTINLTSNSMTAGPPASLSLVSALDFNPQTNLLNSSCIPLKAPLRRNLSLSVLPLPSIGSLVGPKTDSVNRSEVGRLMNEEKHTVSTSQLCGAHIPSDRKKLRTDDKIICPQQMETDPNTKITHPAPSVTQQDANLTYINLHNNPQHTQLKGPLFNPGIIHANASSVSASAAASTPSAAKNSFLPKYQLKLPNVAEPDLNLSPQVVDKPAGAEAHTFTSALSSPHLEQSVTSVTSVKNCKDPLTSQLMLTSDMKKTNAFSSTPDQFVSTICHAATSRLGQNLPCSTALVHKQFAATTITTSCLQDYQAALCSTLMQPSKCTASAQQPRPAAPAISALTVTTASNQTSAAAVKAVSYAQSYPCPNPPLSHTQLSAQSNVLNPVSVAHVSTNTPVVPCHIVPFDQSQPAAQNVFHVHTADLQICLQIISDEQLALIEPQIERQSGPTVPERQDTEAVTLEGVQNKAQGFVAVECSNEAKNIIQPRQQKDKNESFPALTSERTMTSVPAQFGKAEPSSHVAQSNFTQAAASAESIPPETPGPPLHPHKNSHVNTVTESQSTAGDVMSTAAPLGGVKSVRRQTSEEEQALYLKRCGEEPLLLDRKVSQGGMDLQTLSGQHKLSRSSPSSNTVNQNNLKSELLCKEGQHKLNNQGASCNICTMKTKDEASAFKGSRLESAEHHSHSPTPACSDRLSGSVSSFSISKSKAVGQPNPQASIYCSNRVEPTISETLNPSKDADMGCDRVGSLSDSNLLLGITPHGSQDVICSVHSEKRQFASVSSNIQVERYKDTSSACPSIQIPTAGLMEGASLVGCAAQKELQIQEHAGAPGEPDSTDWRQKQSQGAEEKNHQCLGEQGDGGVMGEEANRGIKADSVPGLWGKAETDCRSTVLSKPEEEVRKVKNESFKNPWPAEEHLQHLSQTHSGMSEYPPLSPQQVLSASSNLNIPASSMHTSLFTFPKPPMELNHFYHSQHSWESSVIHNQPTQALTELNSSRHINAGVQLSQTENGFSRTESGLQQAFSVQEQKQTSISPSVQQGNSTAGNNSTAVSSCKKFNLASHQNSNVGTLPCTHSNQVPQACRVTAGSRGEIQPSNMYHNTGPPSKPFIYPETDEKHDTTDKAPSDSGRADMANKYHSLYLVSPLHAFQSAEYLNSGVRPVQSCQEYTEDTSSSDDEGKLIIEL